MSAELMRKVLTDARRGYKAEENDIKELQKFAEKLLDEETNKLELSSDLMSIRQAYIKSVKDQIGLASSDNLKKNYTGFKNMERTMYRLLVMALNQDLDELPKDV